MKGLIDKYILHAEVCYETKINDHFEQCINKFFQCPLRTIKKEKEISYFV